MSRGGKRGLSAEERQLWEKVAKTATPLTSPARNLSLPEIAVPKPAPSVVRERITAFRIGEKARPKPQAPQPPNDVSNRLAQAPVRMDHSAYRKLMRGKLKPEARIDLHGMTIAQAHPALIQFIFAAYDRGDRLVLVITGKGKERESDTPIPIRVGILRHQVPIWLHAPPLGGVILDIREAHQRHGGGGAYYVYLKRPR
ncbi:DNA mismatch repair protein MutS [Rhodobacterales bacterium LSUCC0031]|nr:DNA mismatch repair protein MutS [Rhodobacterales bacterium LSUCC0031]